MTKRSISDEEKEKLAYELALGYFDDEGLAVRFNIAPSKLKEYKASPTINKMVLIKRREIDESDQAIRIHARRAARIAIEELSTLAQDEDAPAKTRMDAARQLREYATVTDKAAIGAAGEGAIYIATNLDLGGEMRGTYALTAEAIAEQEEEAEGFDDLLFGDGG